MQKVKIFILASLCISTAFGQLQDKDSAEAEKMFSKKRYSVVWQYYHNLLMADSLNAELNFKMGICYLNSRSQKEKAIVCFKRATTYIDKETNAPAIAYKYLAEACFHVSDFDDAIMNYQKFKKIHEFNKTWNNALAAEIDHAQEMCKMAGQLKELKELTVSLKNYKNSTPNNSGSTDYLPVYAVQKSDLSFIFKNQPGLAKPLPDKDLFEDNYRVTTTFLNKVSI